MAPVLLQSLTLQGPWYVPRHERAQKESRTYALSGTNLGEGSTQEGHILWKKQHFAALLNRFLQCSLFKRIMKWIRGERTRTQHRSVAADGYGFNSQTLLQHYF